MTNIALEGMAFYSHHGYYTHERKRGNNYLMDIKVTYDMEAAADSDDLEKSLNYEELYAICQEEMNNPRHLIESVAKSIVTKVRSAFPEIMLVHVRLEKLKPELGGAVAKAVVEYEA
jgi:7,8-dihydroneopterin aldolase/epimerase/oxygenase